MTTNRTPYAVAVFAAGMSYGAVATIVKIAYADGFTWQETSFSQGFFAFVFFSLFTLIALVRRVKLIRPTGKELLQMIALGACGNTTTLLYSFSLSRLPVAVAITLMFQFVWMGLVLQAVRDRRMPHPIQLAAGAIVIFGTLFASNIIGSDLASLDLVGMIAAFGSAISCALFMYFNATVGTRLPWMERGMFICLGASMLSFCFCPTYFSSGVLLQGLLGPGMLQGLLAQFLPVLLFGIGTPHLEAGTTSIMASSELPCGIALSAWLLQEPVNTPEIFGVILILGGIVLAQVPDYLRAQLHRQTYKPPLS